VVVKPQGKYSHPWCETKHNNYYFGHAKDFMLFLLVRTCRDKETKQNTFMIMPFHIVRGLNTSSHMWGRNRSLHKVWGTCALPCGTTLSYCPRRNERGHSYLFSLAGLSLSPPTATCRGHPYLLHTCGTASVWLCYNNYLPKDRVGLSSNNTVLLAPTHHTSIFSLMPISEDDKLVTIIQIKSS